MAYGAITPHTGPVVCLKGLVKYFGIQWITKVGRMGRRYALICSLLGFAHEIHNAVLLHSYQTSFPSCVRWKAMADQRFKIKFCFKLYKTATPWNVGASTYMGRMLWAENVCDWFACFRTGKELVEDKPHSAGHYCMIMYRLHTSILVHQSCSKWAITSPCGR